MPKVVTTTTRMTASIVATRAAPRILATLPPATAPRPWVIELTTAPRTGGSYTDSKVIVTPNAAIFTVGESFVFPDDVGDTLTITVVQGSEQFISITTTMITETEMTAADVITETMMTLSAAMTTRMTNALMPTLTTTMTISAMMITTPTLTLYQIITTGIPTTNIGAAIDNSHLPPSFPPSFPQMLHKPKLALAANLRPQLSFPRRRESTRRRAANTDGAKRHLIRRGFYIPVIPA